MTPLAWVGLAGGALLIAGPAPALTRAAALAGVGRLQTASGTPDERAPARRLAPGVSVALVTVPLIAGALIFGGALLGLSVGAVVGAASIIGRDVLRRRTAAARRRELLTAVRLLVADLEVGARPASALSAAAEATRAYAPAFESAAARAADAGDAASALLADLETRPIGFAWRLGEEVGLELAAVLTSVARDLDASEEQRRNVSVALAGPRASAALLVALPLLGTALGAAMGARPWEFLFATHGGQVVTFVGVLLDVGGALWMRAILRRAESSVARPRLGSGLRFVGRRPVRSAADHGLPLVLDLAAAALRSGRPLAEALALAAPAGSDEARDLLNRVASLSELGADPAEAWSAVPRAGPLGELALIGVRSAASGTKLASAFERLAGEIRVERSVDAQVQAQRAGVVALAPLAACFLPSFVCLGVVPVVASIASSALTGLS